MRVCVCVCVCVRERERERESIIESFEGCKKNVLGKKNEKKRGNVKFNIPVCKCGGLHEPRAADR